MKVSTLKTNQRIESRNDTGLNVQYYGERNDYPQRIMEVVDASGTGKSCISVYRKFINGRGFADKTLFESSVNRNKEKADYILDQVSKDLAHFGGFYLHINYNALFEKVSVSHIPFEHVRFEALDKEFRFSRVAIHHDWGKRNIKLRPFNQDDIVYIDMYDPDPETIQMQVDNAGGWNEYKGQVYCYSNKGHKVYSSPIFDAVVTDMSTEEGLSNIKLRNARNNFLPAGMLVDFDNTDESDSQKEETKRELKEFQGDESLGKVMYVQCKFEDKPPVWIPFKANNYDKDFELTEKTIVQNIGRAFSQPPILRAEDVGANFGADLMTNAYDFYNSITENERYTIERCFTEVFDRWCDKNINPAGDYSIIPLSYIAKQQAKDIPDEILKDLTANERRSLVGFDPIDVPASTQKQ